MKTAIIMISVIAAIVLLVFAFMAGVYPNHDYVYSTFLVVWAFAVVWLGGVIAGWVR